MHCSRNHLLSFQLGTPNYRFFLQIKSEKYTGSQRNISYSSRGFSVFSFFLPSYVPYFFYIKFWKSFCKRMPNYSVSFMPLYTTKKEKLQTSFAIQITWALMPAWITFVLLCSIARRKTHCNILITKKYNPFSYWMNMKCFRLTWKNTSGYFLF